MHAHTEYFYILYILIIEKQNILSNNFHIIFTSINVLLTTSDFFYLILFQSYPLIRLLLFLCIYLMLVVISGNSKISIFINIFMNVIYRLRFKWENVNIFIIKNSFYEKNIQDKSEKI